MQNTNTEAIILALQKGDLEALGSLYDLHHKMVYRTALGILGDSDNAADLLQEVFLRLYRFADRIDPKRPIEPWLYRVTANLSYTWAKRQRWQHPLEEMAEWLSNGSKHGLILHAERKEDRQELQDAIQSLTVSQRTVIVLHYINDQTLEEIAAILEVPVGTVKSRLHYARKSLKKQLLDQGSVLPEVRYEFT